MCDFYSCLALRNGDIIDLPMVTNSHHQLERISGRKDAEDAYIDCGHVKIEFTPPTTQPITHLSAWELDIDQGRIPDWADTAFIERLRPKLEAKIREMLVTDKRKILAGGCYILAPGAQVDQIVGCTIPIIDSAVVNGITDSNVGRIKGTSSINEIEKSRINEIWEKTEVAQIQTSFIGCIANDAKVGEISNSRVSAVVGKVRISNLSDGTHLAYLEGTAVIERASGSTTICTMYDETRVDQLCGTARVIDMHHKSSIGVMEQHAYVHQANDGCRLNQLRDYAILRWDTHPTTQGGCRQVVSDHRMPSDRLGMTAMPEVMNPVSATVGPEF